MRRPLPSLPRSGPGPVSCYRHQTVVSLLEIFNQRFAMRRREFAMYLGAALASPTLRPSRPSIWCRFAEGFHPIVFHFE